MKGKGTRDAIFIVRQKQETNLGAKGINLYNAFVDLEKAFNRVPIQVGLSENCGGVVDVSSNGKVDCIMGL